jgi:hypothetical protein
MNSVLRLKQISRLTPRFNKINYNQSNLRQLHNSRVRFGNKKSDGLTGIAEEVNIPKNGLKAPKKYNDDTIIWIGLGVVCGGGYITMYTNADTMESELKKGKYKRTITTEIGKVLRPIIMSDDIYRCQSYIMTHYSSNSNVFKDFLEDYPIDFSAHEFLISWNHFNSCKFHTPEYTALNDYRKNKEKYERFDRFNTCTCPLSTCPSAKYSPYATGDISIDFINDYGHKMDMIIYISSKFPRLNDDNIQKFVLDKYDENICQKIIAAYIDGNRLFSKKFIKKNKLLIIKSYNNKSKMITDLKGQYNFGYDEWIDIIGQNKIIDEYIIDNVLKPTDIELAIQIYEKHNMDINKLTKFNINKNKTTDIITNEKDNKLKGFVIGKLKPSEIIKIFKESDDTELLNVIYMSSHKYIPSSILKTKISKIKASNIITNPPHGDSYSEIYDTIIKFYMANEKRRKTFFDCAKINSQMLTCLPIDTLTDIEWEKILNHNTITWNDMYKLPEFSESEDLRKKLINIYEFKKTEILPDDTLEEFSSKLLNDINVAPINKKKILEKMDKRTMIGYIKINPKSKNIKYFVDKITIDDMKSNGLLFNNELLISKYEKKELQLDDMIDILEFLCKNGSLSKFENYILINPSNIIDMCDNDIKKVNRFMNSNINKNIVQKAGNIFMAIN